MNAFDVGNTEEREPECRRLFSPAARTSDVPVSDADFCQAPARAGREEGMHPKNHALSCCRHSYLRASSCCY